MFTFDTNSKVRPPIQPSAGLKVPVVMACMSRGAPERRVHQRYFARSAAAQQQRRVLLSI